MKPTITKKDRTDANVDNTVYEIKTPYEVTDDYGKTETLHKKEERLAIEYEAQLATEKENLETRLSEIDEILSDIEALKVK